MKKNTAPSTDKAEFIANFIGDNFIRMARALRELQDEQPGIFMQVARLAGLSRRKAFALSRIARQFEDEPEERLFFIGWTKLQLIGRYLTDQNREYLLTLAEQHTVHDLEALLRGETPIENARVLQLYLAQADYQKLSKILMQYGAVASGSGLIKVESALMALVEKASSGA